MRVRCFATLCVVVAACGCSSSHGVGGDAGVDTESVGMDADILGADAAGADAAADAAPDAGPSDGGTSRCDRVGYPTVAWPRAHGAPRSVVAADVNGDGVPDLVVTLQSDDAVGIHLGRGDGTFEPQVEYPAGPTAFQAAVADLNHDGRLDIVVADVGDNAVSVLLGNGDGTFQVRVRYPTGTVPNGVAVADLNGDGRPDVATPSVGDHTVSVLFGNGDGTLQAKRDVPASSTPLSVTIADVSGDGALDLVVANGSPADTVGVLLGNGDGSFQTEVDYSSGQSPRSVTVADIDRDGVLDLVVANFAFGTNTVSVLVGNGDGTFQPRVDYATGPEPISVAVVDLSGDGLVDLVVANNDSKTLSLLFGNPDGTFQPAVEQPVGDHPEAVVSADLNRDGKPDIVTANFFSGTTSVLLGTGDGGFQGGVSLEFDTGPGQIRGVGLVLTADLDFDGKADVVAASGSLGKVFVLLGNGDSTFRPADSVVGAADSFALADVNGDEIPDLVTIDGAAATVSVGLGNGDGTFQTRRDFAAEPGSTVVYVAELTGDGVADIVVLGTTGGDGDPVHHRLSILPGNGDGTFQSRQPVILDVEPTSVAVADVNGDGNTDLVLSHVTPHDGGAVAVVLGNGNGTFQPRTDLVPALLSEFINVFAADATGDGRTDVLIVESGLIHVFAGTSGGSLVPAGDYATVTGTRLVATDINGDQIPDLVGTSPGNTVAVMLGRGDGTLQPQVQFAGGRSPTSVAVADFNSDGRPDFIVSSNQLILLMATCLP